MIVFLKIMMIATLTIITFNLDSSKSFEGEKIIAVGSILKLDKPIFPTFRFFTVDACQRVVAREKTTPLYIRSVIAVLSRIATLSEFPLHGLTIILCLNCHILTNYDQDINVDSRGL